MAKRVGQVRSGQSGHGSKCVIFKRVGSGQVDLYFLNKFVFFFFQLQKQINDNLCR